MKKLFLFFATAIFSALISYSQPIWQPNGPAVTFTNRMVGINTNSPLYNLDVNGRSKTRGNAFFDSLLTAWQIQCNELTVNGNITATGTIFANTGLVVGTFKQGTAIVTNFLGVGTTTPTQAVDVIGNIKASGKISASAFTSNSPLIFEAPISIERARIDDITGNFGIATTNPLEKLHVMGLGRFEGVNGHVTLGYNGINSFIDGVDNDIAGGGNRLLINFFSGNDIILAAYTQAEQDFRVVKNAFLATDGVSKVGIGTTTPTCQLDVIPPPGENGICVSTNLPSGGFGILSRVDFNTANAFIVANTSTSSQTFIIHGDGRTGIGTNQLANGYMLSVKGKIISEEVNVKLFGSWPDFVYQKNYKLMSLKKRKEFVFSELHMPYMKSAKENGDNIGLGETLTGLTQNVEDHDHYLFQHDDRIEKLEKDNMELKKKNKELEKRLEKLENNPK